MKRHISCYCLRHNREPSVCLSLYHSLQQFISVPVYRSTQFWYLSDGIKHVCLLSSAKSLILWLSHPVISLGGVPMSVHVMWSELWEEQGKGKVCVCLC